MPKSDLISDYVMKDRGKRQINELPKPLMTEGGKYARPAELPVGDRCGRERLREPAGFAYDTNIVEIWIS